MSGAPNTLPAEWNRKALPSGWLIASGATLAVLALLHFLILTPFTHNLDDIKHVTMWSGGAVALTLYFLLLAIRHATLPPLPVLVPYGAYLVVLVLSTLIGARDYSRWVGWQMVTFHLSLAGWFLLGTAVPCTVRLARWSGRFWVITALITCGFGILHYVGFMENVYQAMGPMRYGESPSPLRQLVYTFAKSRDMLSTILNKQFFANFLALILPIAACAAVVNFESLRERLQHQEPIHGPLGWALASAVAAIFCAICIYFTFSKASYLSTALTVLLLPLGVLFLARVRIKFPAWPLAVGLLLVLLVTVVAFSWTQLVSQFRAVSTSLDSRQIIWGGAWEMFKDRPILGHGPGSFRLDFPAYRSPDYHMADISNVTLYAHNRFLDLLAETGLFGFATYVAFLVTIGSSLLVGAYKSPSISLRLLCVGYFCGLVALYLGNCFTPMMRWPVGTVPTHLALGLATGVAMTALRGNLAVPDARGKSAAVQGQPNYVSIGLAVASFLFLLYIHNFGMNRFFAASKANNLGLAYLNDVPERVPANPEERKVYLPFAEKRLNQALEKFDEAIALNPSFITTYYKQAHAYNRLGQLYSLMGKEREASEAQVKAYGAYEEMRKFAPDYSEVHFNLAIIYRYMAMERLSQLGKPPGPKGPGSEQLTQEAREFYKKSLAAVDRAAELSNKITVHHLAGKLYEEYAQLLADQDREAEKLAQLTAADYYNRARDLPLSKVVQAEGQLEREEEERKAAAQRAGPLYEAAEAPEKAAEAYRALFEANPRDTRALAQAVEQYRTAGQAQDALQLAEKAVTLNPLNAEFLLLRAELAAGLGREDAQHQAAIVRSLAERLPHFLTDGQEGRLERLLSQSPSTTQPAQGIGS